MKSNTFGLDIGTSKIKAVWLDKEKNSLSFISALSVDSPSPGMQSESPLIIRKWHRLSISW